MLSSSCGRGLFTSPTHMTDCDITDTAVANERNIDECLVHSPPPSDELSKLHELDRSHELKRSHDNDSDPDLGSGQFVREVGIRRRPSLEVVRKKSLSPQRWVRLPSHICLPWLQGG